MSRNETAIPPFWRLNGGIPGLASRTSRNPAKIPPEWRDRTWLRVVFGQPERSFYASELIRDAHTGSGVAQRGLARLEESGLIVARCIDNQKHYRLCQMNLFIHGR